MRRLAVVATARDAYAFIGAQLGAVIALIWLPMVIVTVGQFFTFWRCYNDFIDALATSNGARLGPALLMLMGYVIAKMLLFAVMLGGVVQLAQGNKPASTFAYFHFGPAEWRMFRAFCGVAGFLLLAAMTIMFAANAAMAGKPSGSAQGAVSGLMLLAMAIAGAALAARLLILTPAVAVSEAVPVLRRVWALTIGQFLSLLGLLLLLFLPLAAAFVALELGFSPHGAPPAGATPQMQMVAAVMAARDMLPLSCGLSFLLSPLMVGLLAGGSVSAYRSLKGEQQLDVIV